MPRVDTVAVPNHSGPVRTRLRLHGPGERAGPRSPVEACNLPAAMTPAHSDDDRVRPQGRMAGYPR